jgi:hypothetical protein
MVHIGEISVTIKGRPGMGVGAWVIALVAGCR